MDCVVVVFLGNETVKVCSYIWNKYQVTKSSLSAQKKEFHVAQKKISFGTFLPQAKKIWEFLYTEWPDAIWL